MSNTLNPGLLASSLTSGQNRYVNPRWVPGLYLCADIVGAPSSLSSTDISYRDWSPNAFTIRVDTGDKNKAGFDAWGHYGRQVGTASGRSGLQVISSGTHSNHDSISVSVWYRRDTAGNYNQAIGAGGTGQGHSIAWNDTDNLVYYQVDTIGGNSKYVAGSQGKIGVWEHYGMTYEGNYLRGYRNGVPDAVLNYAGTGVSQAKSSPWLLNSVFDDAGNAQPGSVRYGMVWYNRVLTPQDFLDLWRSPSPFQDEPFARSVFTFAPFHALPLGPQAPSLPHIKVRHGGTESGDSVRQVTADATLNYDDHMIEANGTFGVYLPGWVSRLQNREYVVKNTGSGVISVYDYLGQNIDGVSVWTINAGESVVFVAGASEWKVAATYQSSSAFALAATGLTATEGVQRTSGTDMSTAAEFRLDINGLTADASPATSDYITTYDVSAGSHKKVLISDFPSSGGGASITFGAYASRPSGNNGDMYKATDMPFTSIKASGSWQDFFEGWPITKIDNSSFSWVSQESSAITDYGVLSFLSSGSSNLHLRKKSAPGTPYTIVCKFRPNLQYTVGSPTIGTDYNGWGLAWRESGSGKLVTFCIAHSGSWTVTVDKQNSTSSYNSNYASNTSYADQMNEDGYKPFVCLKIQDNGTNRICSISFDGGNNYTTVHTVGRTDFITADEVGFFIQNFNSNRIYGEFISWEQS